MEGKKTKAQRLRRHKVHCCDGQRPFPFMPTNTVMNSRQSFYISLPKKKNKEGKKNFRLSRLLTHLRADISQIHTQKKNTERPKHTKKKLQDVRKFHVIKEAFG